MCFVDGVYRGDKLIPLKDIADGAVEICQKAYAPAVHLRHGVALLCWCDGVTVVCTYSVTVECSFTMNEFRCMNPCYARVCVCVCVCMCVFVYVVCVCVCVCVCVHGVCVCVCAVCAVYDFQDLVRFY